MIALIAIVLIIILNTLVLYLYLSFQSAHSFFKRINFPSLKPKLIVGHFGDVLWMRKPLGLCISNLYEQLEPYKYAGIYMVHRPTVMIRDPELIKNILVKDFDYFRDRGLEFEEDEPMHRNLLRMSGDEWKTTRMKLNPFFKLAKMKTMIRSMQQCAHKLGKLLDRTNGEPFDIKMLSEQYTIDTIGSCAFGINFSAMEDPNCLIRQMANRIFKFRFQTFFRHVFPKPPKLLLKIFNLSYSDHEVEEFFATTMRKVINLRRRSLNLRNDLVTLLVQNKNRNNLKNINPDQDFESDNASSNNPSEINDDEFSMEFKIAQGYLFFAAGFETTSSALAYVMMELALNQSIQNKVREEIFETLAKHNGQITYDSAKEMTYIDMVIEESLRLHPPAAVVVRKCSKAYQIPDTKDIIPEKMFIMISVYGLHTDPKYYEKPDEFYPEHFTKEAKSIRPSCAYIPFGEGPRSCIAERFGKMEIKLAVVNTIKDYVLEVSPKMKFPVKYIHDMKVGLLAPKDGIWLQCKKLETKNDSVGQLYRQNSIIL